MYDYIWIGVDPAISEAELQAQTLAEVADLLGDTPPRRVIVRAPKLVNIVPG